MRRGLRRHEIRGLRRRQGASRRRNLAGLTCGLLVLALAAAGCGAGGGRTGSGKPTAGGTATYALPPNTTPNYIFPFMPGQYFTQVNTGNLQYLMYRPLYWFGTNGLPYLNKQLSLAQPPAYEGQVVTIKLKHYRWSNNQPVTAQDVLFWMHMLQAVVKNSTSTMNWGGYVPGDFPDNVRSVRAVGTDTVRIVIKGSYSRQWFTDNELSQITPMPLAWDMTASGRSDCAVRLTHCTAVFKYLDAQAKNPSTWAQSPLWRVVDGPWQLNSLDSQGVLTFGFNPGYSGPVPKAHISKFKELPFTSEEAEYNVLAAGGGNPIDVGYLPTVNAPVPPPGHSVGANPLAGYRLQPLYVWGLSYFPYNFSSSDPQLPIISQLYFREALQLLENQAAIIQGPLHGYGHVSTGPVGSFPRTMYLSLLARQGDPFPYNPAAARNLLTSHGWTVNPSGISTCGRPGTGPGECGKGVRAGGELKFSLYYATGNTWLESALLQLKSNAAQVGIDITLIGKSFNDVLAVVEGVGPGCPAAGCPWELADWGLGWSYVPDYLPTGDELFGKDSFGNLGHYSNPINDVLIKKTLASSDIHVMWKWENYLTKQLPVVYQPDAPSSLLESIDSLHIGTQSPTLAINPEDWYFVR